MNGIDDEPQSTGRPMMDDRHDAAALDWAIRVADPAFDDWDGFTEWLEGDPARLARYDAIVAGLAEAEAGLAATPAAVIVPVAHAVPDRRRPDRRWLGGAIAAMLVGGIGLGAWTQRAQPYMVETAVGRSRTVDLPDGSRVTLAGGTRIRLDHGDARVASVEAGEALFRVHHDASHPFRVRAGGVDMIDLGTVFDVSLHGGTTRVAVAEGAVMVDPGGAAVRLDPGQAAVVDGDRIVRQRIDPADVGSWRDGRLAFDDVPLADVAADLSRHLGTSVRVVPAIAGRRFRGTLYVDRLRDDPALLGSLLGVRVRAGGSGWSLEPRG
jgi:transmembrane sensor